MVTKLRELETYKANEFLHNMETLVPGSLSGLKVWVPKYLNYDFEGLDEVIYVTINTITFGKCGCSMIFYCWHVEFINCPNPVDRGCAKQELFCCDYCAEIKKCAPVLVKELEYDKEKS